MRDASSVNDRRVENPATFPYQPFASRFSGSMRDARRRQEPTSEQQRPADGNYDSDREHESRLTKDGAEQIDAENPGLR
jgi:hypothetical protein